MTRSATYPILALAILTLATAQPVRGEPGSAWLRAGQPAPHAGVLLSPEAAAKAEAVIAQRDALLIEAAARTRATTAQAELADAWKEQLMIERERSADYRDGRAKAESGWKWQRRHGRWRWLQGVAAGVAAGVAIDRLAE